MKAKLPAALATARVIKKIPRDSRGSKGWSARYGEALICVRHRMDPTGTRRLTTVELVVSDQPIQRRPSPTVDVALKVYERDLQARIKAAGHLAREAPCA